MSRMKLTLGAAIAALVCISAFSAASASALGISVEQCKAATGTAGSEFTSSTCTTSGAGGFHKVPFTAAKKVKIVNPSTFTLKSTNAGVEFEISCTSLSGETEASDAGETINSTSAPLTFSGCTVTKPSGRGCVVKAPSGSASGTIVTNNVTSKTTRTGTETYKQVYSPASGTTFVTIIVSGCSTTALNGEKAVTGTAAAVISGGMKAEFTETSGSELKFGGQTSVFKGTAELAATEGGAINVGE